MSKSNQESFKQIMVLIATVLAVMSVSAGIIWNSQLRGKSFGKHLKDHQFVVAYYNTLMPLYDEYFAKIMQITYLIAKQMDSSPHAQTGNGCAKIMSVLALRGIWN